MIGQFVKRPIPVKAVQWTGDNFNEICLLFADSCLGLEAINKVLVIPTLEGSYSACPGHYIIRGVKGECYPCREDIFRETYVPFEDYL